MNHERPKLNVVEQAESMLRHPSIFGDAPARLHRERLQRDAAQRICVVAAHLHDFFRYGDPAGTPALELYLHENQAGLHAEVLLDELAAALDSLVPPPAPERGVA